MIMGVRCDKKLLWTAARGPHLRAAFARNGVEALPAALDDFKGREEFPQS